MSADVLTFPGDGLPDRPITEQEVDKLHSKNFRYLEGRISNCMTMAAIAHELVMAAIVGIEQKAQFAACQSAQMLKQLQIDYHAAWHGEIELDGN